MCAAASRPRRRFLPPRDPRDFAMAYGLQKGKKTRLLSLIRLIQAQDRTICSRLHAVRVHCSCRPAARVTTDVLA